MNEAAVKKLLEEAIETYREFCHEEIAGRFEKRVKKALAPPNRCPTCGKMLVGEGGQSERNGDMLCWCADEDEE